MDNLCKDHSGHEARLTNLENENKAQWGELGIMKNKQDSILTRVNVALCTLAVVLILLVVNISIAKGATQTINTLPEANATFITDLQTFLQDEQPNREALQANDSDIKVISGGIGTTSASLTHTISEIKAFPNGYYVNDATISHTYTLNTRTFVYVRDSDTRTITIGGATITYDGNFVFAEMAASTAYPGAQTGTLPLFYADTDGTSITDVVDYRGEFINQTTYFPDYRAGDHGITGNNNTLKYYIDTLGSNTGTLYLRHNSGLATTTYTLTTSETIPSNITLKKEPGVIIGGAGTLTIDGFLDLGLDRAFGSSIIIAGSPKAPFYSPYWWQENTTPGTTDMATAIQNAINLAEDSTACKTVELDADTNAIGTKIEINDAVFLQGQGPGFLEVDSKTVLKWIGAVNGTMIEFITDDLGQSVKLIRGGGINGLSIDGNSSADVGLEVNTSVASEFINLDIYGSQDVQLLLAAELNGIQASNFDMINCSAQGSADAIRIIGDTLTNVSLNHFGALQLTNENGVGLDIGSSDGNYFDYIRIFTYGTGTGIILRAGTVLADTCRRNTFGFVQSHLNGLTSEGTASGASPALANTILYYSLGNNSPLPNIEEGSLLDYRTDDGTIFLHGQSTNPPDVSFNTVSHTVNQLTGELNFKGYNDNSEIIEYFSIQSAIATSTDGAEAARTFFKGKVAGADQTLGFIGAGLVIGTPTGLDKGIGTINAENGVYDNNVLLTDYVHDAWIDGEIDIEKYDSFVPDKDEYVVVTSLDKKGKEIKRIEKSGKKIKQQHDKARAFALTAADQLDTEKWVEKMKTDRKLPAFPGAERWQEEGMLSTGDMVQRLWETVEVMSIHIAQLHERLKEVEGQ